MAAVGVAVRRAAVRVASAVVTRRAGHTKVTGAAGVQATTAVPVRQDARLGGIGSVASMARGMSAKTAATVGACRVALRGVSIRRAESSRELRLRLGRVLSRDLAACRRRGGSR